MATGVTTFVQRLTKRSLVVVVVVVVVAGALGASAWALTGGSSADYRTAVAAVGDVQETLDSTGTLEPVNERVALLPGGGAGVDGGGGGGTEGDRR